ncbi:hypothetical protein PR003_g8500 [Phytophthora rubi]|uniref:Uncharacterized protein n=1 Tax=Phytophthora rubi TaxID=129364 RepID=A0A6A3KRL9_9STRA|nr:hypothetical protein PR001_g16414 [Phytophthora rubi]KAE9024591.1 hypothetical protein PR002_g11413 [Phytophthora rubi]KAE9344384.1 hypothetical protein PR003_g8500 [Phytophthora rubi]
MHVVAVLLHRCRPFLSCCSATTSSSATAPMPSISIVLPSQYLRAVHATFLMLCEC